MWIANNWREYELIDASGGDRLERWGEYIMVRPDPQAIWETPRTNPLWNNPHARYHRSEKGGGEWEFFKKLPENWTITQNSYKFKVKPMGFKHMGLFPEQLVNWQWSDELIKKSNREIKVLNLFAYTGGASIAALSAGASVCHVDASKGMIAHAKDNAVLSRLADKPIRYIIDDCMKFVEREIRRGNRYDAIIMDPPSYGRGPGGEVWKIETELFKFVNRCVEVLSDEPLFVLLNSYTTGLSASTMQNVLDLTFNKKFKGTSSADEIGIPMTDKGLILPCGSSARWQGVL